jgi:putative ABC transport system permease protein
VLTASAAARLRIGAGDALLGRLARVLDGRRESVKLALVVQAVAPPAAFARDAAFVPLALAVLVEDFQDGRIGPPDSVAGLAPPHRAEYAGFRLYARRLETVPALDTALQAAGIEVVSRAGDVSGLLRIDRNLGLLLGLVAGLGGLGFLVSLGAGLWANVERKRVPLAQLRFLGFRAGSLRLFPMAQAAVLAALGVVAALTAALAASLVVNRAFAGTLALDRPLCLITPGLAATAACVTLAGAVLVAAAAGTRAAQVEPWEGVSAP